MNLAHYSICLSIVAVTVTLAYVAYWVGLNDNVDVIAFFIVWPVFPYLIIAGLSARFAASRFSRGILFLSCLACVLIAASRYFVFWLNAMADPGYTTMIIRFGFMRVPLEQCGALFLILAVAWVYRLIHRR